MSREIEIKFLNINKDDIRMQLEGIGLSCLQKEFLMVRKTFHHVHTDKNEWFRIRKEAKKTTMTYKCIHENAIDGVEEYEIIVDDLESAAIILQKTGLNNTSTQENYREIWGNEEIEICIDTWPSLKPYIEIEGKSEDLVRKYSEKLGFDFERGFFGGTEVVYESELGIEQKILVKLPQITFDNPPIIK